MSHTGISLADILFYVAWKWLPKAERHHKRASRNNFDANQILRNRVRDPSSFIISSEKCLGGTLRIYADSLKPNIPYKTILLSTTDTADFAVAEALEKYGLEKENPRDYCIAW
ncbi:afadin isoform X1, partial [Tachysurus ichikawai]